VITFKTLILILIEHWIYSQSVTFSSSMTLTSISWISTHWQYDHSTQCQTLRTV